VAFTRIKIAEDRNEVLQKMMSWCAYQERSQDEAMRKLAGFGLSDDDAAELIARLISENFINEERFALAFAGGKFRIKQWGRIKIRSALRLHKISDYSIKKALAAIDAQDYENTMVKLIEKKLQTLKAGDTRRQFYSTLSYMVSRGFESDLATEQLNTILHDNI